MLSVVVVVVVRNSCLEVVISRRSIGLVFFPLRDVGEGDRDNDEERDATDGDDDLDVNALNAAAAALTYGREDVREMVSGVVDLEWDLDLTTLIVLLFNRDGDDLGDLEISRLVELLTKKKKFIYIFIK